MITLLRSNYSWKSARGASTNIASIRALLASMPLGIS
jgi:hypothetical protein